MSETRGRKPGYKHSEETKKRISDTLRGQPPTEETKRKMSDAKKGRRYSPEHRENMSRAHLAYELDEKCIARFEDLKASYPEQEEFFVDNRDELLFAMRDVRTEKELTDIRRYVETAALRADEPYQYESTSCYAAEDAMIALLDFKRLLQTYH